MGGIGILAVTRTKLTINYLNQFSDVDVAVDKILNSKSDIHLYCIPVKFVRVPKVLSFFLYKWHATNWVNMDEKILLIGKFTQMQ